MKIIAAALFALALASTAHAGQKARKWEDAKVLDTNAASYYTGTYRNQNVASGITTQSNTYVVVESFAFESADCTYVAQETLKWKWSKAASVAVNGKVQIAAEGRRLFVMDDTGKEHEMALVRKVMK